MTKLSKVSKSGDIKGMNHILDHPQASQIVDWAHPVSGMTSLMVAAYNGRDSAIELLISHKATLNTRNKVKDGNTALHYAAYRNESTALRLLLSAGADPYLWNTTGHSAIDLARFKDYGECERVLSHKLLLYSGWVYLRNKPTKPLSRWKHRYVQILWRLDSKLEMAFYRQPSIARPTHVILLNDEKLVRIGKSSWTDKEFMLSFTTPVLVQKPFVGYFSRDPGVRAHFQTLDCEPESVKIATDDILSLEKLVQAISGENDTPNDESPLFPTAPPAPSAPPAFEGHMMIGEAPPEYESLFAPPPSVAEVHPIPTSTADINYCSICMENPKNAVCVPCGHISSCFDCLSSLKESENTARCPICRNQIESVIRVYNA